MDDSKPNLDRDRLWNQLSNAIALRSSEDQVLWSIFGAFWASNAILLVAFFTTGKPPSDLIVGIVITVVGFLLSLVWYLIQARALGHVKRYEEIINSLEVELEVPKTFAVSGRINVENYISNMPKGPRARLLMQVCSFIGTILWGLAALLFIIKLTCYKI